MFQTLYPTDTGYNAEGGPDEDHPLTGLDGPVSTQSVFSEVAQKHILYLVSGCFTYVSGGKLQFTVYCFMLDPRTSPNADVYAWRFLTCPYGNDDGELEEQAEKK
jgi:hypothetical protein